MNNAGNTFMEPELEREVAGAVVRTTRLVRDGGDKDDVRRVFARFADLNHAAIPSISIRLSAG